MLEVRHGPEGVSFEDAWPRHSRRWFAAEHGRRRWAKRDAWRARIEMNGQWRRVRQRRLVDPFSPARQARKRRGEILTLLVREIQTGELGGLADHFQRHRLGALLHLRPEH